ncbi:hypothetical protein S40293_04516 [Stachybotrys chartarum IBT 40293]|nr:hypothetical protein S40293_04516 [Stachybotrys chartarum IBT 40293]
MDPSMPMILPKGIVVNTKDVYQDVANHRVIPMDQIRKYWHVYTTTNKKLQDPTACRLENFWWHVWGSDRRRLSGRTLARLYEDISTGPTFVPLRGPPNRWEGPDIPPSLLKSFVPQEEHGKDDEPSPIPVPKASSSAKLNSGLKSMSSSASKPPPAHPILKKSRGPSSSGPRPTARFVSPHESANEDDQDDGKDSDIVSSGSTVTPLSEMRPSTMSPAKKKHPVGSRKFVVSAVASKRRPLLARRQSSQSSNHTTNSTGLDGGNRDAASSGSSRNSSAPKVSSEVPEAISKTQFQLPSQAALSDSPDRHRLSEKAAGKRPAIQRRMTPDASKLPKPFVIQESSPPPVQQVESPRLLSPMHQSKSLVNLPSNSRPLSPGEPSRPFDRPSVLTRSETDRPVVTVAPTMVRSHSYNRSEQPSDRSYGSMRRQGLFTGATASTTNIAAQGTIIDQSGLGSLPVPDAFGKYYDDDLRRTSSTNILDSRMMTPTQPKSTVNVPLARTRSQLTLLLEREKARNGDKTRY